MNSCLSKEDVFRSYNEMHACLSKYYPLNKSLGTDIRSTVSIAAFSQHWRRTSLFFLFLADVMHPAHHPRCLQDFSVCPCCLCFPGGMPELHQSALSGRGPAIRLRDQCFHTCLHHPFGMCLH